MILLGACSSERSVSNDLFRPVACSMWAAEGDDGGQATTSAVARCDQRLLEAKPRLREGGGHLPNRKFSTYLLHLKSNRISSDGPTREV